MLMRTAAAVLLAFLFTANPAGAADPTDAWIEGYAAAVFERERGRPATSLRVSDGVVTIDAAEVADPGQRRILDLLRGIRGVRDVRVVAPPAAPGAVVAAPAAPPAEPTFQIGVMPGGQLFTPFIADPRWPHFGASYQYYLDDPSFRNVGAVSLGESFVLYRNRLGPGWWEIGVQAGVFSVFDLDASSFDLINTDFLVAVPVSYRISDFSAMLRLSHESSHLGDELLLREDAPERVGLSFEAVDLRLSWEPGPFRVYAGGGYLIRVTPDVERWMAQYGVEFRSPWPAPAAGWRPILGVDVQQREETDWNIDLSVRAGVQFDGILASRSLQLLVEYYRGHSPHGQFFTEKIEHIGLGLHFHF
jgi:hypothetical protein